MLAGFDGCVVVCCHRNVSVIGDTRWKLPPPRRLPRRENPPRVIPLMGWLGSRAHLVGRIGVREQASASFQIFALRVLLDSVEVTFGGGRFSLEG